MIERVSATEVIAGCRQTIGISENQNTKIDDALLMALARRSAGFHCPCSRATLRASLLECLHGLPTDCFSLPEAVDDTIEALIVGGDLLELSDVSIDDSEVKQTWVFAAPPSFVVRASGTVFLFGIVPDQESFLPSELNYRVSQRGYARVLEPESGEDLPIQLRENGLQQLSESAWLKCPRTEDPHKFLDRHQRLLADQPTISEIHEVQILDWSLPVSYYRGRWTTPAGQHGTFVARRPQEFGAPIWCLVELQNGKPVRLLDLPLARTRWRGCDIAWHLQLAIDHLRNAPQCYRRRMEGDGVRFDFFSPVPQWSQRRLIVVGRPVPREKCLFSYIIPKNEADSEEEFLRLNLWLSRLDGSS
ncbi:MAG: hypothetical protein F4Z87_03110 [Gammaproteobacteria bacterium]|nr:hypothetical protein [Gammaproteobacteria bacterium]